MHCPACSGTPALLGALGRTKHFRCIHCGWQWARTSRPKSQPRAKRAGGKS